MSSDVVLFPVYIIIGYDLKNNPKFSSPFILQY